jgi:cupin fold WbuC family metalloprotein
LSLPRFRLEQVSANTFLLDGSGILQLASFREILFSCAKQHPSGSARVCFHRTPKEPTQNMIICLRPHCSFLTHKHPSQKRESYTVLEGLLYVDLYSESGNIDETLALNPGNTPYIHDGLIFHSTYTKKDWCLYQEVYHGTHDRDLDVIEMNGV